MSGLVNHIRGDTPVMRRYLFSNMTKGCFPIGLWASQGSLNIERPEFSDPSVGVSTLLGEETLQSRQEETTVSSGSSGVALLMSRTNAT